MNYAHTEVAGHLTGAGSSINSGIILNQRQKGDHSSTIMTDKSPGDYVNQVTIGAREADINDAVASESSQLDDGLGTQQSVVVVDTGIRHQS